MNVLGCSCPGRPSLRSPRPTAPPSSPTSSLAPPRSARTARSLSPALNRSRPPALPVGPAPTRVGKAVVGSESGAGDGGAAALYQKAAELRSSLDVPSFRVPILQEGESISLPASPLNPRKIGLSCLTPPSGRKLASCVSPSRLAGTEQQAAPATAPATIATSKPFSFQLCTPDPQSGWAGPAQATPLHIQYKSHI